MNRTAGAIATALAALVVGLAGALAVRVLGPAGAVTVAALVVAGVALTRLPMERAAVVLIVVGWATSAFISDSRLAPTMARGDGSFDLAYHKVVPLVLLAAGAALALLSPPSRRSERAPSYGSPLSPVWWLAAYAGWMGVTSLLSPNVGFAAFRWFQGAVPVAAALAYVRLRPGTPTLLVAVAAAAASNVVLAVFVASGADTGSSPTERVGGYVHPVVLASQAAIVLTVAAWLFTHRRQRVAGAGLGGLAAQALVRSGGRTGLLGILFGLVAVVFVSGGNRRERPSTSVQLTRLLLPVALVGAAAARWERVWGWVQREQSSEHLADLSGRMPIWEFAVEKAMARPLTGWGAGTLRSGPLAQELQHRTGNPGLRDEVNGHAHNAVLEALLTAGIVGAALWLGVVAATARALAASPFRALGLPVLATVVGISLTAGDPAWFGLPWYALLALVVMSVPAPDGQEEGEAGEAESSDALAEAAVPADGRPRDRAAP